MKTLLVRTLEQWRDWLAEHRASEPEVWLIFHKQHTGVASIDYKDALDEALCFGWVDSLVKRLDDRRYARKFTPRRADSRWSAINRKRYAQLRAAGRLKRPGSDVPRPTAVMLRGRRGSRCLQSFRRTSRRRSGITRQPGATSKRWRPRSVDGILRGSSPPSTRKRSSGVSTRPFAFWRAAKNWD